MSSSRFAAALWTSLCSCRLPATSFAAASLHPLTSLPDAWTELKTLRLGLRFRVRGFLGHPFTHILERCTRSEFLERPPVQGHQIGLMNVRGQNNSSTVQSAP